MKIEKKNLNEALKVLGKVVSHTSPVEDAVSAILPVTFGDLLAPAAPIIDRNNYRHMLMQGCTILQANSDCALDAGG